MDLLLQAAKVLEQENSIGSPEHVSARSTRGSYLGRTRGESHSDKDDSFGSKGGSALLDDAGSADDEALSGSERRRAGGAGTREVHNQLEKNRRKQMRECFNYLQHCIPNLENKRVATQSILQGAIKHIKSLKKKNVEQEREIQMLAKRKSELKRKHDLEFNKSTEDQQRMAEVMLKMRKPVVHPATPDEDGHTSDSTTTASEGPGNEDDFSDEEKVEDRERVHLSRVNPVVAAKLDGFRKRKLASLDSHPKSTDYIIVSMKDAGLLTAPPQKQRSSSISSVSSSSVALKNMLEQKKKQQSNHFTPGPSIPSSSSVADKTKLKNVAVPSSPPPPSSSKIPFPTNAASKSSSLISSHPMISNQLAAVPSLPLALHGKDVIHPVDNNTGPSSLSSSAVTSNLHQSNGYSSVSIPSHSVLSGGIITGSLEKEIDLSSRPNSIIYAPSSLMTTVLDQTTAALQSNGVRLNTYHGPVPADDSKTKHEILVPHVVKNSSSADTADSVKNPFDFSSAATHGRAIINPNNPSPISVIQAPIANPGASGAPKVLSSVIPMSMLRGLPLHSGLTPMAVTLTPSSTLDPAVSVASPNILPHQKVHSNPSLSTLAAPEFLLAPSPVKTENVGNNLATTHPMNSQVTALLAASLPSTNIAKPTSTLLTTIPAATNPSSSAVGTPTNLSLQDKLKTMAIAPTLLPLTVTGVPLSTSTTHAYSPMTPALRFYSSIAPNSVVAAAGTPFTNSPTASLMPTVVRLGVLQNFIPTAHIQVQSPQMIAQPIMVVSNPSSVDSASASVLGTQSSASSSSLL